MILSEVASASVNRFTGMSTAGVLQGSSGAQKDAAGHGCAFGRDFGLIFTKGNFA